MTKERKGDFRIALQLALGLSALAGGGGAANAQSSCPDRRAPFELYGYGALSSQPGTFRQALLCIGVAGDEAEAGSANAFGIFYSTNIPSDSSLSGKLVNVAPGAVTPGSTDAANGSQVNTLGGAVAAALGGGSRFDTAAGRVTAPVYVVQDSTLSNVGSAVAALDATTTRTRGDVTQLRSDLTTTNANVAQLRHDLAVFGSRIDAIGFDLRRIDRQREAGDARSAALAGMPQVITPGRGMIAGSVGGAGGTAAFAVGASKSFPDQNLITRAAASFTTRTHEVSWNVGAGFEF